MEHGRPVTVEGKSTLADGLAVPRVGCNAFATAAGLVDKMVSDLPDFGMSDEHIGYAEALKYNTVPVASTISYDSVQSQGWIRGWESIKKILQSTNRELCKTIWK